MDHPKRRETDKAFLKQITPGNWLEIALLALALAGQYSVFQYRISALENDHKMFISRETVLSMDAATRELLQDRLRSNRDNVNNQFIDIRTRLDRIERKLDAVR